MPRREGEYLHTTMHDFKTNFSRYLRAIERGEFRGIIVKRYNKKIGAFIPFKK